MLWYYKNVERIDILVILEPMVNLDELFYCNKLGYDKVVSNVSNKIWCFCSSSFDMEVFVDTEQLLHCFFSSASLSTPCLLSMVYAKCTKRERLPLWDIIRSLVPDSSPWLLGGDFNIITNSSERIGGSTPDLSAMSDFGNCLLDTGLLDIGFVGPSTTWERDGGGLQQRLDRILLNQAWLENF